MHILFFDHWDKGIRVFKDAILSFQEENQDIKMSMVHLDTFFRKKQTTFEVIDDINVYDISYFETNSISKIIDKINPDIIIITNVKLYERIICLNANKKSIPIYYFLHGNIGPIFKTINDNSFKNLYFYLKLFLQNLELITKYLKVYKNLYFPCYVIENNNGNYISRFFKFFIFSINKLKNRFHDWEFVEYSNDFFINYAVVYTIDDALYLKKTKVNIETFLIKGNLEIINNINKYKNIWKEKKQIVIIDDGFAYYNYYNLDTSKIIETVNHIVNIFKSSKKYYDYEIVFKIKPHEIINFETLKLNCKVIRTENIYKTIQESEIIIGTYSTALKYAIVENKPIFILNWSEFKSVPDLYLKYRIGISWNDKNYIPEKFIDTVAYKKYILDNNLYGTNNTTILSNELS
jgi:hypothetical protein